MKRIILAVAMIAIASAAAAGEDSTHKNSAGVAFYDVKGGLMAFQPDANAKPVAIITCKTVRGDMKFTGSCPTYGDLKSTPFAALRAQSMGEGSREQDLQDAFRK